MSTDIVPIFLYYYTQTLTSVELQHNQIGDDGAQYLADVLKTNTVTILLSTHIFQSICNLSIDA